MFTAHLVHVFKKIVYVSSGLFGKFIISNLSATIKQFVKFLNEEAREVEAAMPTCSIK